MFQKNLVVWKPGIRRDGDFGGMVFQKNLVVWKLTARLKVGGKRGIVSEELSSVETYNQVQSANPPKY